MREIKFRGKSDDEWVYGLLLKVNEGDTEQGEPFEYLIQTNEKEKGEYNEYFITDNQTIGQYVGLKDKKEIEMYEGDIVLTKDGRKAIIEYSDVYASYFLDYIGWCDNDFLFDTMELEVIGNIYDNPELLKEGD